MSISRKDFLKQVGFLSIAGVATAAVAACGGGGTEEKKAVAKKVANPCTDVSGVSQAELGKRTTFKYVEVSEDNTKHCVGCALFIPPAAGKTCGGCTLFAGPVTDNGHCSAWAAKPNMG